MYSKKESEQRQTVLKKAGVDSGATFLPAQELSKLQAGLLQSSKIAQEHYITLWFPELRGRSFEQMTDWLSRNDISFQCVGIKKPDPNKIRNVLQYVCYRPKPRLVQKAFIITHELTPLPQGGFMASCTHESSPWPEEIQAIQT